MTGTPSPGPTTAPSAAPSPTATPGQAVGPSTAPAPSPQQTETTTLVRVDEPLQVRIENDGSLDWSLLISAAALIVAILVFGRDVGRAWRQRRDARFDTARRVVAWLEVAEPTPGNQGTVRAVIYNGTDGPVFNVSLLTQYKFNGVSTQIEEREEVLLPGRHDFPAKPISGVDGQPAPASSKVTGVRFDLSDGDQWSTEGSRLVVRWGGRQPSRRDRIRAWARQLIERI